MPRPRAAAAHPSAEPQLRSLDREATSHGARLSRVRELAGLKLRELGEVFGVDVFGASKLEAGAIKMNALRVEILQALERAFTRSPPSQVWGPRVGLTAGERIARIFVFAYCKGTPDVRSLPDAERSP